MIAAVGGFPVSLLAEGLRAMAANANAGHEHEFTGRGAEFQHDSGWGAVFRAGGRLERLRSTAPCFRDAGYGALDAIRSDLVVIHARRAKNPRTISTVNTHPFVAGWRGGEWAFCHNGEVRDTGQLTRDPALVPEGSTDSELLFFHILTALNGGGPAELSAILSRIRDFTCVNCLVVRPSSLLVSTRRAPDSTTPRYYTMWRADGDGPDGPYVLISSEPLRDISEGWRPLDDGSSHLVTPRT
jgi:predicted glutamine amidotransferase